jgi:hypothetical protein
MVADIAEAIDAALLAAIEPSGSSSELAES